MNLTRRDFVKCVLLTLVWLLSASQQTAPQVRNHKTPREQDFAQNREALELREWCEILLQDYPRVLELPVGLPGVANDRLFTGRAVLGQLAQTPSCSQPNGRIRIPNSRGVVEAYPSCLHDSDRAHIEEFVRTEGHSKADPRFGTGEDGGDDPRIGQLRYSDRSPLLFSTSITVSNDGIDSNDEISGAKAFQSRAKPLLPSQRILSLGELIFYDLSRTNYSVLKAEQIPSSMISFIKRELEELVSAVPETDREKFPGVHLKLEADASGPLLLMRAQRRKVPPFIQISPLLVRTLFFYCVSRKARMAELLNPKTPIEEIERIAELVRREFASQLHYFLAHELGHIYLATDNDEERCDDFAFNLVRSVDKSVSLDAAQLLFAKPTEDDDVKVLWGLEQTSDGEAVAKRMQRLAQRLKDE